MENENQPKNPEKITEEESKMLEEVEKIEKELHSEMDAFIKHTKEKQESKDLPYGALAQVWIMKRLAWYNYFFDILNDKIEELEAKIKAKNKSKAE